MNQFQMNESDKAEFLGSDEGRGRIRLEAARSNPHAESIQIVDSDGNLFDTISGVDFDGETTEPGLAVVLTDEQLEERRLEEALHASDLARVEDEIRPLVMSKLKDEARSEIREEFRQVIQQLRSDKAELQSHVGRLTEGVRSLTSQRDSLKSEIELFKASHS